jgi:hypothetical protein
VDCILGYHANPLTCGVAKFNVALAARLGIPVVKALSPEGARASRPLLSIKVSEFRPEDAIAVARLLATAAWRDAFSLFLHDWTGTELARALLGRARVVFCGNTELVEQVRALRADAVEAWCPSTVLDPRRFVPTDLSVFSFGMAHKVRTDHYARLKTLLDATGRSYCLYLSTALHEDTTLDGSFSQAFEALRAIFGERVHFLGYLSDTAVYNYLLDTTFYAAFFERGVRANNTTALAAMSCGAVMITNRDAHSPAAFAHMETVIDIARCAMLPTDPTALRAIGERAAKVATGELGWDALVAHMTRPAPAELRRE